MQTSAPSGVEWLKIDCEFIFSFSYLVEVTMVEVNEELQISRAKSLE